MANIAYTIIEDWDNPTGTLKWAQFVWHDGFAQIHVVLNSEDNTLIDNAATQYKVNEWVEEHLPWNETV
tara:strand:- start:1153 stop:1359 length:207 start_codon:yes stop_codon:yes gene_type:complete